MTTRAQKELGRLLAEARRRAIPKQRRTAIARNAANARWAKKRRAEIDADLQRIQAEAAEKIREGA